jgi:regulatory protein
VARIENATTGEADAASGPRAQPNRAEDGADLQASGTQPEGRGGPDGSGEPGEAAADPYAVARAIVLRQLTMAPRSRHQLREKLRQRDCPDEVAEAVLDRMTEVGLVDDEKYAEALVRSTQVSRGLSRRGLAHELRTKGVARETADAVLDHVTPAEEESLARSLVEARLARLRGLDKDVVMRRLAGMLARKGYPAGLSLRVVREAVDADPAFRRD